jgi:hypothetical protein
MSRNQNRALAHPPAAKPAPKPLPKPVPNPLWVIAIGMAVFFAFVAAITATS